MGVLYRPAPWIICLLALLLTLPQLPAAGQVDTGRREALEAEIERYQQVLESRNHEAAQIEQELAATSGALRRRLAERDDVSEQLSRLNTERARLEREIADLDSQLAATEESMEMLLGDLEELKRRIRALLVNLHRQRTGRFARILSQSETFHELQVKNHYLSLLSEQDANLMAELDDTLRRLEETQARLSSQLADREAAERALVANLASLEEKNAQLAAIIAELESTRAGQLAQRQSLIEAQEQLERTLGELDRKLDDEIARLREEEERLRRQAAQAYLEERQRLLDRADEVGQRIENLTGTFAAAPSGYVYPLADHTVLSRYGQDNNSFMALRAPSPNAPVVAVQDGVVRATTYLGANDGFMVRVDHSNRLSTVYTNLRPPRVQLGERVVQGQVLGFLGGSTLVAADTLKLWVQVTENGRSSFVDPAGALGF